MADNSVAQGPEIKVNNKRQRPGTWIRTVLERLNKFEEVEVKALGSAISNAIYAAKTAEERGMATVTRISTELVTGQHKSNTSSILIQLKRTPNFSTIFQERPVFEKKV